MTRDELLDFVTIEENNAEHHASVQRGYARVGELIVDDRYIEDPADLQTFLVHTAGLVDQDDEWLEPLIGPIDGFRFDLIGWQNTTVEGALSEVAA